MERQSRRQYTADYKAQAVSLADSLGAAGAARKLGISVKTLAHWIRAARNGQPVNGGQHRTVSELEAEVSRLRAENATLRMEREFLKKNHGVLRQGVRVKYACIASQGTDYPIELMCRVLAVSRSGFFVGRRRYAERRPDPDAQLREDLRYVHQQSRQLYGRRRLVHALRARGHCINPKRVRRLMREEGLRGVRKGRFVPRTTDSQHTRAIACNVLARRFGVNSGVVAWTSDITYVPTREGWLYLAVIIALHTRQVLGYSLSDRMPDELVLNALRNACRVQPPAASTVFHSDRGSQYASDEFRAAIGELQMVASMSRKGNCWDNAVAESFFATLKAEEISAPYKTQQQAHRAIAGYIHGFYNPLRLHCSLGYLSPNEYAQRMKSSDKPTSMRSAA